MGLMRAVNRDKIHRDVDLDSVEMIAYCNCSQIAISAGTTKESEAGGSMMNAQVLK